MFLFPKRSWSLRAAGRCSGAAGVLRVPSADYWWSPTTGRLYPSPLCNTSHIISWPGLIFLWNKKECSRKLTCRLSRDLHRMSRCLLTSRDLNTSMTFTELHATLNPECQVTSQCIAIQHWLSCDLARNVMCFQHRSPRFDSRTGDPELLLLIVIL
jgi:hypothetical protein